MSDDPLVDEHYATQLALTASLAETIRGLDEASTPDDLRRFEAVVASLVGQYSLAAISLSADYYDELRTDRVGGRFTAPIIEPMPTEAVTAYLDTVAQSLLDELAVDLAEGSAAVSDQIDAAAQKLVADASRRQIITATELDREAHGWARVVRPGACSFCLMLASRGPVYKTKATADFRAHLVFNGRGGNCQCTAEPVFGPYEAPAHVREALALWSDSTTAGQSPKEARNAFRRALAEQRKTTR